MKILQFSLLLLMAFSGRSQDIVTTIAGTGTAGYNGENIVAASAQVGNQIDDILVDDVGNVYIAESSNFRIRKIDINTGLISTIAGNGSYGYSGDGGQGISASIQFAGGLALDTSGNLYFSDFQRIRKVNLTTGIITTIAGTGNGTFNGDGMNALATNMNPYNLFFDSSGDLVFADRVNSRIRKIDMISGLVTTLMGDGTQANSGDGGHFSSAQVNRPSYITQDNQGNLYVGSDYEYTVRKVDAVTGIISTVAGNGVSAYSGDGGLATSASIRDIAGLAVDGDGNLFIGSFIGRRLRKVDANSGIVSTAGGTGNFGYNGDGIDATTANLLPKGLDFDPNGNLIIVDGSGHNRIRKIEPATTSTFIIPDPNFAAFLDSTYPALISNGNELDIAGAATITGQMNCGNLSINDLTGIDFFTGISSLICSQNNLSSLDISNLDLSYLSAHSNNLSSITGLSSNSNLTQVFLEVNQLADLSDLSGLSQLTHLYVHANQLTNFPNLSSFPALVDFNISNNPLPANGNLDISANPNLTKLQCGGTNLASISGLANTALTFLECKNNQITDLADLQNLPGMTTIWAEGNQLTTFPSLSSFPNLDWIQLTNNPLNLGSIDVSSNSQLQYIQLASTGLTSVSGLANLNQLVQFNAQSNSLTDISDLQSASTLKELFVAENQLTSLPDFTGFDLTQVNVRLNKLDFSDAVELKTIDDMPNLSVFVYSPQNDFGTVQNAQACTSNSLTLSIDPQASATSYQWFKDGNPISGATSSDYTISSFSAADVGIYTCQSFGSALDYPSPMNFSPGISSFQSEPINVSENTTGCTFTIPDPNFAAFLTATYPSIMSNGNQLDIAGAALVTGALNCTNQGIADLTGIEFFVNVKSFVASQNNLVNTHGLEALTQAHTIYLDHNQLSSLPDFTAFPNLTYVRVNHNPLTDTILDLTGNTLIRELSCGDSNLTEILGLGNQTSLKHFGCERNALTNLNGIANAAGLVSLKCHQNQITSLPNFSIWPDLGYVSIGWNPLPAGVLDVSQNPQIRELGMDNINATGITGLSQLTELKHFGCGRNEIPDLNGIENAANLVSLKCERNKITSLPPFSNFPNLAYVQIGNNLLNLGSFDLSSTPNIRELGCSNSGITEFVGLSGLTELRFFDCSRNELASLAGLAGKSNLIAVGASFNQLEVLPDLSSSSNLSLLRVERNNLTFEDIEPNLFVPTFTYYLQGNVGLAQNIELIQGENLDVTIPVGGVNNVYQWFKDGVPIAGQTSDQLLITGVSPSDAGTYTLEITNTLATALTLESEPIDLTVIENRPPVAVCQDITVSVGENCDAAIVATDVEGGSSDPDGDPLTYAIDNEGPFGVGTHQVTLTVTDPSGETSSCMASVTVVDDTSPSAISQDLSIDLDGNGNASITAADIDNGSTDACGVASISVNQTDFDCSHVGANTVTLTVTDVNGNVSTETVTVTVNDVTSPTITGMPSNIVLTAPDESCQEVATWNVPSASDNCPVTLTSTHNSGDIFEVGTTTVTYTATDASGNAVSSSFDVTVEALPMTLSLNADLIDVGHVSCFGATDGEITSITSGGCTPYTYDWSNGATTADVSGVGAGTYTLTVYDSNGSSISETITLTEPDPVVTDIAAPATTNDATCAFPDANLIFGYPGGNVTSVSLSASAIGGNGDYSYSWYPSMDLDDPTSANPVFSPTLDETGCTTYGFTVTVTDDQGCEDTEFVTVNAVNVGVEVITGNGKKQKKEHKVLICHKGKNTISVDYHAVPAHLAHGDCLGSCDDSCGDSGVRATVSNEQPDTEISDRMAMTAEVFPNPTNGQFRILMDQVAGHTELQLFNLSGKMVQEMKVEAASGVAIEMGKTDLESGLYMLRIIHGENVITRKISVVK